MRETANFKSVHKHINSLIANRHELKPQNKTEKLLNQIISSYHPFSNMNVYEYVIYSIMTVCHYLKMMLIMLSSFIIAYITSFPNVVIKYDQPAFNKLPTMYP